MFTAEASHRCSAFTSEGTQRTFSRHGEPQQICHRMQSVQIRSSPCPPGAQPTAHGYGVEHSLHLLAQTALLSLVSMCTSGVSISLLENLWISLSTRGARFLNSTPWMCS